jgi:DNA-directed RNA polymerase subunit M/transcription elongation factor TFIIS
MHFCEVCNNMMFIRLGNAPSPPGSDASKTIPQQLTIKFECKNCGHTSESKDACIIKSTYDDDRTVYKQFMSKYISHDITLPRVDNIRCPTCFENKTDGEEGDKKKTDVIYVKYDENLKFLYSCEKCKTFWKSG